jgi:hypothetical protein
LADDFAAIRSRMRDLQREREQVFAVKHRSLSVEPADEQQQPRRPFPERTRFLRDE